MMIWDKQAMPNEIVLLTGEAEVPHLTAVMQEYNAELSVTPVLSDEALQQASQKPKPAGGRRLIAYCTSIIVSRDVLAAMDGPSYNFHPGPPTYPGVYPANFAVYDGAMQFGVTAHVMAEQVDEGAIVGVDYLEIPADTSVNTLEIKAYLALFELFKSLCPQLVNSNEPLPELDIKWGERKTTKQDFDELKQIGNFLSEDEKTRRQRAFG